MYNQKAYGMGSGGSIILKLFNYGLQQAAIVGKDKVYDFSIGNPSIPAPKKVNDSIVDIVNNEDSLAVHGYTPAAGSKAIRDAVAGELTKRMGMEIRPENLFFTCGAAGALTSVMYALNVDAQTEVLAIAPFFSEYRAFAEGTNNVFKYVPADTENFQINFEELENMVNVHTQTVIINSPNNPSGVVFSAETIKKLADILTKKSEEFGHPIYLVADEPYRELVYGDVEVPWVPSIYKDTIVCYSYSKSLSLPGERIGYICVPDQVTDSKEIFASCAGAARAIGSVCAPSLIQRVVARCVDERPDLVAYDENRKTLYEGLTKIGYKCAKPDGAFYLFVKAPNGDAVEFSEKAMEKNLLVVPSNDFGVEGFLRVSYCVSHNTIVNSLPVFEEMYNLYK